MASEGEGKGSEFVVEIPGVHTHPEPIEVQNTGSSDGAGTFRVLVADDGKSTADILGMFFRMEGMECEVVYNGAEAVSAALQSSPDLICLDLGMPVLDGYQAAMRLRKICPNAYIVALSGWGSEEDRKRTSEAGFDAHLVKPVNPDQIRELVQQLRQNR